VKIGPVYTELAFLAVKKRKKEEINASKIYSPFGKCAERAKLPKLETNPVLTKSPHLWLE